MLPQSDTKESLATSLYQPLYPPYHGIRELDEIWKQGIKMSSEAGSYADTSISRREKISVGSTIPLDYNRKKIEEISDRIGDGLRRIVKVLSGPGDIKLTNTYSVISGDIVYIERLQDPRYELIIPIPIRLEQEGGEIILSNEKLNNIYGVGNTIDEAMADFEDALLNYYDFLLDEQENLSAFFKEQLEYLKERILIK